MQKTHQTCSGCGEEKPLNKEFFHYRKGRNKYYTVCIDCRKKRKFEHKHKKDATKECTKCHKVLKATTENFNKNHTYKDGLSGCCKKCLKEYQKSKPKYKYAIDRKKKNESQQRYRERNKDKIWMDRHKRRAQKRQLKTVFLFTEETWVNCKAYFANKCAYCGLEKPLTQEHFIPLSKNGEFTVNNIIPACRSCNPSKGDKDFFEWYPNQFFYSKKREKKILEYLNYNQNKEQQLALL